MSAIQSLRLAPARGFPVGTPYLQRAGRALLLVPDRTFRPHGFCYPKGRRTFFYLPTVLQPSFWKSLVPSFLRRSSPDGTPLRKRPWNPATYFIWMFLLIGSQAIQTVALRSGFDKFTRDTEQRLALLRDVVKRVQAGEEVDVEKELGTGDPAKEKDWDQVMQELAQEDAMFQSKRKQKNPKPEKGTEAIGSN